MPFVSVDGQQVHYSQAGDAEPAVVFVHGAGGSGRVWHAQLSALGEQCHAVALDLPGHGRSEGNPLTSIKEQAGFVARFLDILGLDKIVLAGHSMGGAISLELALSFPSRLQGLVLLSTGARLRVNPQILQALERGEFPFADAADLFASSANPALVDLTWQEMRAAAVSAFLADFQACDRFNRVNEIGSIQMPVQIIAADQDVMTPLKYSHFLHQGIAGSRLAVLKEAGHMGMVEKPAEVNQTIMDFLQELSRQ